MGNFTKDPAVYLQESIAKGYNRVRFQQGKPILDSEINLLSDLASPDRLASSFLGNGAPAGSDGFRLSDLNMANNDFTIAAGTYMVNGMIVELASPSTYQGQPVTENIGPIPTAQSNVYLHVFTSEIDATGDPDLNNSSDVGFETSVRDRIEWEVIVSTTPIEEVNHALLARIHPTGTPPIEDLRRTELTLSSLHDEIRDSRGTASSLAQRLDTSINEDGSLNADSVASPTIIVADGSSGQDTATGSGIKTDHIQDNAITANKIANEAVTLDKMDSSFLSSLFTKRGSGLYTFSQSDADGATRTITTTFRPRCLIFSGYIWTSFSGLGYRCGVCCGQALLRENGSIEALSTTLPYLIIYSSSERQYGYTLSLMAGARLINYTTTPYQDSNIQVAIDDVSDTSIRFRLNLSTPDGRDPIASFYLQQHILILG